MPVEHPLSSDEIDELSEAAADAEDRFPELDVGGDRERVVALAGVVDRLRSGERHRDEDVFGLGVIWLLALGGLDGFSLVRLAWPDGPEAEAAVTDDRGLACLALHHVRGLVDDPDRPNDLLATYDRLGAGQRPNGAEAGRYAALL